MTLQLATDAKDVPIDVYDWPRCARCHMPVEHFGATVTPSSVILVAKCHGAIEAAEIPDAVWDTMLGTHVSFGLAFQGENNNEQMDKFLS